MSYETELLERLCLLEVEAMATIGVTAYAKPYALHTQETFPYFTHRITANPVSDNGSEELDLNNPLVIIRLVIGHATEGYKGQPEGKLYEWGPVIKTYIQNRTNWLQAASGPYQARMENLIAARVIDNGGFRIFENSGISVNQVGREFQVQCSFTEPIEQEYY